MDKRRKCMIAIWIGLIVMVFGEVISFRIGEEASLNVFSLLQLPFFIGICIMVPGIVFLGENKSPLFTSIVVDLAVVFVFVFFVILIPN